MILFAGSDEEADQLLRSGAAPDVQDDVAVGGALGRAALGERRGASAEEGGSEGENERREECAKPHNHTAEPTWRRPSTPLRTTCDPTLG